MDNKAFLIYDDGKHTECVQEQLHVHLIIHFKKKVNTANNSPRGCACGTRAAELILTVVPPRFLGRDRSKMQIRAGSEVVARWGCSLSSLC